MSNIITHLLLVSLTGESRLQVWIIASKYSHDSSQLYSGNMFAFAFTRYAVLGFHTAFGTPTTAHDDEASSVQQTTGVEKLSSILELYTLVAGTQIVPGPYLYDWGYGQEVRRAYSTYGFTNSALYELYEMISTIIMCTNHNMRLQIAIYIPRV
jgi:hypothetical protein